MVRIMRDGMEMQRSTRDKRSERTFLTLVILTRLMYSTYSLTKTHHSLRLLFGSSNNSRQKTSLPLGRHNVEEKITN